MSIEITHPEKPTEQDKIDDNDYMLPHKITGVLPDFSSFPDTNIKIPILIETKTVSTGVNSVLFEDLDGDNDLEYYIIIDITCTAPTGSIRLNLYPNSSTTNIIGVQFGARTLSGPFRWDNNELLLGYAEVGTPVSVYATATFTAKTGKNRKFTNQFITLRGTQIFNVINTGFYTETSTNITSLLIKLVTSTHTFTGTIKLYKLVDITLEDLPTD